MSANASISVVTNIAGQTNAVQITRTADGVGQWTPSVAAAHAGSLTTRTDNDTGVATLSSGHGIQSQDKVDVFWSGGRRYNMTATVATNEVTIDGGGGDNLPAQSTALVVCKHTVVNAGFDPDDVTVLVVSTTKRASVVFVDSGGNVLLALDLAAGEFCLWFANSGITRPFTGNPVAALWVGNGDSAVAVDVVVSVMYDATP